MNTIGIDIGGTNARVALLDGDFNIREKVIVKTGLRPSELVIKEIVDIIKKIDYEKSAKTIGICVPGAVDKDRGMMLDAINMEGWLDKPLKQIIEGETGRVTYLTNDANAAAMAQTIGDDGEIIVFITVSTGIGGGIVYKGNLIEGKHSYTGEFGSMIVCDEDRKHSSLYAGSLESLCSGVSLAKKASLMYGKDLSTRDLFEKYQLKEEKALKIVHEWVEHFSRAIANITHTLDPNIIYLGGAVILNNKWLIDLVKERTKGKVLKGLKDHINLCPARYGEDAGIIGAAYNSAVSSGNLKYLKDN